MVSKNRVDIVYGGGNFLASVEVIEKSEDVARDGGINCMTVAIGGNWDDVIGIKMGIS